MIPEIGIIVGVYVLVRLIGVVRPSAARGAAVAALAVAAILTADLVLRGFANRSVFDSLGVGRTSLQTKETSAQPSAATSAATVTRTDGGSIQTNLGFGIVLSKESTLKREWIAIHEPAMPVDINGTPGVTTAFVTKTYGGEYRYRSTVELLTKRPVRAVQVHFLIFDVWGQHVRTLSLEEVADIAAGAKKSLAAEWNVFSENEAERHYASIGYVARVRLDDGHVVEAPTERVVEEARKFSSKFTTEQLEPKATPNSTPNSTPATAK